MQRSGFASYVRKIKRQVLQLAQRWKVGERTGEGKCAVVCVELEAYPEPKVLTPNELAGLALNCGGARQAAAHIGASEAFVRQNMQRLGGTDPLELPEGLHTLSLRLRVGDRPQRWLQFNEPAFGASDVKPCWHAKDPHVFFCDDGSTTFGCYRGYDFLL